jgi:hypothetical protein
MYYSPLSIDNLYNDEEYGKLTTEQKTLQWENVAR